MARDLKENADTTLPVEVMRLLTRSCSIHDGSGWEFLEIREWGAGYRAWIQREDAWFGGSSRDIKCGDGMTPITALQSAIESVQPVRQGQKPA